MLCPSAAELEALFDPGPPRDPARASALLAHVRECARCHEALREDLSSRLPAPGPAPRPTKAPRPILVLIAGVGLALIVFARTGGARRHRPSGEVAAPTTSASTR